MKSITGRGLFVLTRRLRYVHVWALPRQALTALGVRRHLHSNYVIMLKFLKQCQCIRTVTVTIGVCDVTLVCISPWNRTVDVRARSVRSSHNSNSCALARHDCVADRRDACDCSSSSTSTPPPSGSHAHPDERMVTSTRRICFMCEIMQRLLLFETEAIRITIDFL